MKTKKYKVQWKEVWISTAEVEAKNAREALLKVEHDSSVHVWSDQDKKTKPVVKILLEEDVDERTS